MYMWTFFHNDKVVWHVNILNRKILFWEWLVYIYSYSCALRGFQNDVTHLRCQIISSDLGDKSSKAVITTKLLTSTLNWFGPGMTITSFAMISMINHCGSQCILGKKGSLVSPILLRSHKKYMYVLSYFTTQYTNTTYSKWRSWKSFVSVN